jgi:acyl-CoA thioester hydrolase
MFKLDTIVRFSDCDALGHVNNAKYFTYFEEARSELFRIFNPELDIQSWNLIVASTRCDFLREVIYAQKISVYTWISRVGTSSFEVEHAIQDEQGLCVARGKATLLAYDFEQKKPTAVSEEIRSALLEHCDCPVGVPVLRS